MWGQNEEEMMKQKRFFPGIPTHNYQKGHNGNLLFYTVRDRLVYFTLFCSEARQSGVKVLSLNLMFTHTHSLIEVTSRSDLSRFNLKVEMKYALEFNRQSGHRGPVFLKTYGWAQKRNSAKVRSCLAYIGNNHVEKKLCRHGMEERWSLLAYAFSTHPFSDPLVIRRASAKMKKAVKLVKDAHRRGQYLNYTLLDKVFDGLDGREQKQLIDFIIVTYSVIDYDEAARYFGSKEKMIAAFDTTTGSEYEISENDEPEPDIAYKEMLLELKKAGFDLARKDFLDLPSRERGRLVSTLLRKTSASQRQVSKLLRLENQPAPALPNRRDFQPQPPFFVFDSVPG